MLIKPWKKAGSTAQEEFRKLHYFAVTRWQGEMQPHEAEAVLWISLNALSALDLHVDRMAVAEYVRVYTP